MRFDGTLTLTRATRVLQLERQVPSCQHALQASVDRSLDRIVFFARSYRRCLYTQQLY